MKPRVSFLAAGALCVCMSVSLPANADDKPGACNIKPADLLATFGYAATGQALAGNSLGIPAGAFAYVGTATGITANQNGNNIVGMWTTTFAQSDSSGRSTTYTVPGTFTVSTINCTGDFSWNNVGLVFRAVFVNHSDEFRAISTVPGVIISYTSGKKL